jgi:hypothetical protein
MPKSTGGFGYYITSDGKSLDWKSHTNIWKVIESVKFWISFNTQNLFSPPNSASLFYIVKSPERERSLLNVRIKQKTISVLLKAMDMHCDDPTMMRNGCLTLCQFKIPQDVVRIWLWVHFCHDRSVLNQFSLIDFNSCLVTRGWYWFCCMSWGITIKMISSGESPSIC